MAKNFSLSLDDLDPAIRELLHPHMIAGNQELLDAMSSFVAGRRDEAKQGRVASGAEAIWNYCEEAYAGIDNANRHESLGVSWYKPYSSIGPVTNSDAVNKEDDGRSTIYVPLSARYSDAAASRLSEIICSPDDRLFSIHAMPHPDLIKARGSKAGVLDEETGAPLTRPMSEAEMKQGVAGGNDPALAPVGQGPTPPANPAPVGGTGLSPVGAAGGQGPLPPGVMGGGNPQPPLGGNVVAFPGGQQANRVALTEGDIANENIRLTTEKAKKAEDHIFKWMEESNYTAENRRLIKTSARLGSGILKAPFPKLLRGVKVSEGPGEEGSVDIAVEEKVIPGAREISPWNFFPDPTCGSCIHDGEYVFEADRITEKSLVDFKLLPGYLKDQIDKVVKDGPDKRYKIEEENGGPAQTTGTGGSGLVKDDKYMVWYYTGNVKREHVETIELLLGKRSLRSKTNGHEPMHVVATLVNDTIIKCDINPLNSGSFNYHVMPWRDRPGCWFGVGVIEQIAPAQRGVNGATRAMVNNAGVSAGAQIVFDQMAVEPADGNEKIYGNKLWYKKGEAMVESVGDAFQVFNIPNATRQLMELVNYFMAMAEEASSIPLIAQGQTGESSPETLGATQIQNTNSNTLIRATGYSYDENITEPVARQYYEWYLLDPDVEDGDKVMFHISAHGSVTLVDRAIQDQSTILLKPLFDDVSYGGNKKRYMKELLKAKRFDPAAFLNTKEEQDAQDKATQPADPRIEAAKINAETVLKVAQGKQVVDEKGIASKEAIAGGDREVEGHRVEVEATVELHRIEAERQNNLLKYANDHQITIAQAHAMLAATGMKLETQERLNARDNHIEVREKSVDRAIESGHRDKDRRADMEKHGRDKEVDLQKHERDKEVDLHKHANASADVKARAERPPVQAPGRAGKGKSFSQARGKRR